MSTAIRQMRRDAGISMRQLSAMIGIDSSHLSKIEHGMSQPTVKRLYDIAEAVGADALASHLAPHLPQRGNSA